MALFLDSVEIEEVRRAAELGFVTGVTTNPNLIAAAGRPAIRIIAELCTVAPGIVFHQLTGESLLGLEHEAESFLSLAPGKIALKIPCHIDGLRLARQYASKAVCAVTAIYTPAQAYLASEAGAHYLIPYVNRASKQGLDALELVRGIAEVATASGRGAEVLAASIKTAEEGADVLRAGARHLTLPWHILLQMVEHDLTRRALEDFAAAARKSS